MKIIKKTKQFLKENWKPIVIGGGIGLGCAGAYLIGYRGGERNVLNYIKDNADIQLDKPYVGVTAPIRPVSEIELLKDNSEVLKHLGVLNSDDKIKAAIMFQKIES